MSQQQWGHGYHTGYSEGLVSGYISGHREGSDRGYRNGHDDGFVEAGLIGLAVTGIGTLVAALLNEISLD